MPGSTPASRSRLLAVVGSAAPNSQTRGPGPAGGCDNLVGHKGGNRCGTVGQPHSLYQRSFPCESSVCRAAVRERRAARRLSACPHYHRLSRGRVDFSARDHASDFSLARCRRKRREWRIEVTFSDGSPAIQAQSAGERTAHRRDRPALRRRHQRTAQADTAASGGADLESGCRDLGGRSRNTRWSIRPR